MRQRLLAASIVLCVVSGCAPHGGDARPILLSPEATEALERICEAKDYEGYLLGIGGRESTYWLSVVTLIETPGAAAAVESRWNRMTAAGKVYGAAVIQRQSPERAATYWAKLLKNRRKVDHFSGCIDDRLTISEIAAGVQRDMTVGTDDDLLKALADWHPRLAPLFPVR